MRAFPSQLEAFKHAKKRTPRLGSRLQLSKSAAGYREGGGPVLRALGPALPGTRPAPVAAARFQPGRGGRGRPIGSAAAGPARPPPGRPALRALRAQPRRARGRSEPPCPGCAVVFRPRRQQTKGEL